MMTKTFVLGAAVAAFSVGCISSVEADNKKPADQNTCTCEKCGCKAKATPKKKRPFSPSCRPWKMPFKIGVARFTMHKHTLDEALDIMQNIDCHYLGFMEGTLKYSATEAEIAAYKAKCAKAGVEVVSAGPLYYDNEASLKACCEFAKHYGMKYISVVPFEISETVEPGKKVRVESDAMLDLLEKYCKEYDLRAAIHNHGPDIPYLFPTAEAAMKRIANRDKRIGVCLDIGHERRAGLDPEAFIRQYPDRVIELHLKNIKIDGKRNRAKEGPRGELDIAGIFKALGETGFDGYCLIEFEKDFELNEVPLAESLGYYRGVADTITLKPTLAPVPAGANTLTDAEKADGFKLLFDGKNLPTDLWVGAKKEWDYKKFPERGWYVRDGALTMRPMSMIANGKWVPLPEEDRKLAGGGDIVTAKKYKDFIFTFDFRLTEAANSGVKYFYNEGKHRSSCMEYQVLDAAHPDYANVTHRIAALYELMPAPEALKAVKPLGQWNSGKIVSKGNHVEHWLNGVKVLEYTRGSEAFRAAVAKSKYLAWQDKDSLWGEATEGRLLLQDHGDSTVSYCNLKIKEL